MAENNENKTAEEEPADSRGQMPVPPPNWSGQDPLEAGPGKRDAPVREAPGVSEEFRRARVFIMAGEGMALVSMLFGGLVLCIAACIVVGIGIWHMWRLGGSFGSIGTPMGAVLKWSCILAAGICGLALSTNIAAFSAALPQAVEMLQQNGVQGADAPHTGTIWD